MVQLHSVVREQMGGMQSCRALERAARTMISVSTPVTWLAGYIPDIPTPFDQHGAVDLAALAMLCERQIDAGVSAIRGQRNERRSLAR